MSDSLITQIAGGDAGEEANLRQWVGLIEGEMEKTELERVLEKWRDYKGEHRKILARIEGGGDQDYRMLIDSGSPISFMTKDIYLEHSKKWKLWDVHPKVGYQGAGKGKLPLMGVVVLRVKVNQLEERWAQIIFSVIDIPEIAGSKFLIGNFDMDANRLRLESEARMTRLVSIDRGDLLMVEEEGEDGEKVIRLKEDKVLKKRGLYLYNV